MNRQIEGAASAGWGGLFAASAGLVALLAPDGRVQQCNRAGLDGRPLREAYAPASAAAIDEALEQLRAGAAERRLDVQLRRPDGSHAVHLLCLSPVRDGDTLTGIAAQAVDITERHREEARLRRSEAMMVDTQGVAHLGVWEWDITQPHAVWSPELYRIYGLDPATHVPTYEDYLTRVHPDDRQRVIDATNAAFHDHRPYSHDERIYRADGSLCHLHTWAYPVLDENGKLVRLTGVCQDITDRAVAEQAVVEHAAQLARANAELEQFARLAAHDLQEPLRTIASFVQILARNLGDDLDPDSAEAMDFILGGVRRMKTQIDDLLKYVRTTAAQRPVGDVDLGAALARVLDELRAAVDDSGAQVSAAGLPPVRADAVQVDSLLRNLIDNAIKFRGAQAPRIEISARSEGAQVEVVVRDNGIGIEPRHAERVFLVFQRLDPQRPGTGIGLAVCKKIVDGLGGRIWLESTPGQGCAFHFTLPAATPAGT